MKQFTQIELANCLGVKQPTISKYLNGQLRITATRANKLNKEFNIPFDFWEDPKSYLQKNNTKQKGKHTTTQR